MCSLHVMKASSKQGRDSGVDRKEGLYLLELEGCTVSLHMAGRSCRRAPTVHLKE